MEIYSKHCQSQTGRARELKFERMFIPHYVSGVRCHVSRVMCHVSPVMCHMSPVTCHFFCIRKISFTKIGQSGGASRWRVCYQRGLPRLVLLDMSQWGNRVAWRPWHCLSGKGHGKNHKTIIKTLSIDALVRVCIRHNLIRNYLTEPSYRCNYQKEL